MILDDVHRGITGAKAKKRVGRGPGSGHGKTSTRGHKGQFSRSGSSSRLSFEGGQVPLARRIAKRGFNNAYFAPRVAIVNLSQLEAVFDGGASVTPKTLAEKGLVKGPHDVIKILGNGKLTKKLQVQAHRFSKSAEKQITDLGGSIEALAVL
jgi:large subunit ribosomal protein L15